MKNTPCQGMEIRLMKFENTVRKLRQLLESNDVNIDWLDQRLESIHSEKSSRALYLTYSLLASKVPSGATTISSQDEVTDYLRLHSATKIQIARIYLLARVLENDREFFSPKVAKLIEVADTSELVTFLRFLPLLPNSEDFKNSAVEALRTNIAVVFDAIALNNPYPALYFNDQQWNQMYLKAAFMQRDLSKINDIDTRANEDLSRIISDYAHERWAASRPVDPLFWRPVSPFLEGQILGDMERLIQSDDTRENMAGALCCYHSDKQSAMDLLKKYPKLLEGLQNNTISWNTINQL
jgi:hypothetical protein